MRQQVEVANAKRILGIVAAGVPAIDGRHRARIRRNYPGDREDEVAVFTAACREGGNHGMFQAWKHAFAVAPVVQRVFLEGLRQGIARRSAYRCDGEDRCVSLAVTLSALRPLWRR